MMKENEKLAECPICFEMRILDSSLGDCEHYICYICQDKCGQKCPICRGTKKVELERNALRLKRLERESAERKRSTLLLATTGIYGSGDGGNGNTSCRQQSFNQMYNPQLS